MRTLTVALLLLLSTPAVAHGDTGGRAIGAIPNPAVVGHRAKEGPNENTLVALRWDAAHHTMCETDTWRIADAQGNPDHGISVIFHDKTIGRMTTPESRAAAGLTKSTPISTVEWWQFQLLRTPGGEPLPTLGEWLQEAADLHVQCMVEVKWGLSDPETAVRKAELSGSSFYQRGQQDADCSFASLDRLQTLGAVVGVKVSAKCPMPPKAAAAGGYSYVTLYQSAITPTSVAAYHAVGVDVSNMSVGNNPAVWQELVDARVDYIITSKPGALWKWLA